MGKKTADFHELLIKAEIAAAEVMAREADLRAAIAAANGGFGNEAQKASRALGRSVRRCAATIAPLFRSWTLERFSVMSRDGLTEAARFAELVVELRAWAAAFGTGVISSALFSDEWQPLCTALRTHGVSCEKPAGDLHSPYDQRSCLAIIAATGLSADFWGLQIWEREEGRRRRAMAA